MFLKRVFPIDCDEFADSVKIVDASDVIAITKILHKKSHKSLPGGALIVADRDLMNQIRITIGGKPRMLDTLSFCTNPMHFELLGRPPVIIFATENPVNDIRVALLSKTGFSKASEFSAHYVRRKKNLFTIINDKFQRLLCG